MPSRDPAGTNLYPGPSRTFELPTITLVSSNPTPMKMNGDGFHNIGWGLRWRTKSTWLLLSILLLEISSVISMDSQRTKGNRRRVQYTDYQYLPPDLLLPGEGSPPKLTPDFNAMRATLDRINLLTHKIPHPVPPPHSGDLFPFVDVTVTPVSDESAMQNVVDFLDGKNFSGVGYHPLKNGTFNATVPEGNTSVALDACVVSRWNYEVVLSHVPNIIFRYLAVTSFPDDASMIKGMTDIVTKVILAIGDLYLTSSASMKYFEISPKELDLVNSDSCSSSLPFPYQNAVKALFYLHNITTYNRTQSMDVLNDLVNAAGNCLGGSKPLLTLPKLIPCVDFSLQPTQLVALAKTKTYSIFNNPALCDRFVTKPIQECVMALRTCTSADSDACYCTAGNLVSLSIFARAFYMCNQLFPRPPLDQVAAMPEFTVVETSPNPMSNVVSFNDNAPTVDISAKAD